MCNKIKVNKTCFVRTRFVSESEEKKMKIRSAYLSELLFFAFIYFIKSQNRNKHTTVLRFKRDTLVNKL